MGDCLHLSRRILPCTCERREASAARQHPYQWTEDNDGDDNDAHLPLCGNEGQAVGENGSAQSAPVLREGWCLTTHLKPEIMKAAILKPSRGFEPW